MRLVTLRKSVMTVAGVSVVVVAVFIAAAYIGVLDLMWSSLVKLVRLG